LENRLSRHVVNMLTALALVAILYFAIFKGKTLEEGLMTLLYIGLVILGLGFIIFFHELGHYLAAKLCDTKVEVFSVGFGPPLPGCHFKYGETLYKLAVFPIGGYVKLPGENPGDLEGANSDDPRLLPNKSVGQRLLIFSAGVIMNVLLGAALFVIVYLHGKKEPAPILGAPEPGSPAARAGIEPGSRLLQVDNKLDPTYEDLFFKSALASPNRTEIYLRWRTPDGEEREGIVIPRKLATDPKPVIGVGPARTLKLMEGKIDDEGKRRPLVGADYGERGSPVAEATFEPGDTVLGIRPTAKGGDFEPLAAGVDRTRAEFKYRKQSLDYQVQRGEGTAVVTVKPRLFYTLGLRMKMGPIVSVASAKYTPATAQQFKEGDLIVALEGNRAFDPLQFPDMLADAIESKPAVNVTVERDGKEVEIKLISSELRRRGTWNEEQPLSPSSPVGVPSLGIAYRVEPIIVGLDPKAPEAFKSLIGGRLVQVNVPRTDGSTRELKIAENEFQWPALFWDLQADPSRPLKLYVEKDGNTIVEEAKLYAAEGWYSPTRGFVYGAFEPEAHLVVAENVWHALELGAVDTGRFILRIYMNLRSLVTGNLSVKFLSGPIEMFKQTYSMAEAGGIWLIWFLGVISINLAVVNFLPIPVLDGGHVMFLLIEKIRGKPASERMLIVANIIGLSVIASLMLFVVFLDFSKMQWVQRLFGM
jgi:regulator of sigma E protease